MSPEKVVVVDWLSVSVLEPRVTIPEPDSAAMVVPAVVPEMSNVPSSATPLLAEIEPEALNARVPAVIVVAPV